MPFILLAALIANLITIALIWLEIHLIRQWYLHKDLSAVYDQQYAQKCLAGAIIILIYLLLGKFLVRKLISKSRKGEDEPIAERYPEQQQLHRPDGSIINIEYGGVKGNQTIIFLHGWNSNSMQWYYQKKYFEKDYHIVLIDHPGLGKSKRPDNKDYSLEKLAADLDAVIEAAPVKDPILWGHSMGGFTILTFCKLYFSKLQRVNGIILQHTTYTNPTKTILSSRLTHAIQNPILRPLCWGMIKVSPLISIFKWMSYLNGTTLLMARFMTYAGTQTAKQLDFTSLLSTMAPAAITGRGVLGMFNYDATSILKEIHVPTLIIGADTDRLTKLEASITMNNSIPGSSLVTLSPAGHMGLIEQHALVNQKVTEFLTSRKKYDAINE
ncbi:pimeloyl-ACP methyl ester carboxylesterase [Pedobacter sp. CAN_A7]|uniref:alpha/beta fold hydrolase n=1 Tax=Pedobacter sp. CAN_A7 TaxID=2787722 RepID=UPI0018CA6892